MEFYVGDRIHVTVYEEKEVDFYATLSFMGLGNFRMKNCSDKKFEDKWISMPDNIYFGIDNCYYYTLVTDDDEKEDVKKTKPTKEQLLAFAKDKNIDSDPVIDDASAARHFRRQRDQYKEERDLLLSYINLINGTDYTYEKFKSNEGRIKDLINRRGKIE